MAEVQCIVEVRPLVRSLACYLTNCPNSEPDITMNEHQIHISWKNQPPLRLQFPYKLLLDSLKGVNRCDDGVSFCIRTGDIEIESIGNQEVAQAQGLQLAIGTNYSLQCSKCKADLNESLISFKLIFPLPSHRWKSASSDWFCHKSESVVVPNKILEPKPHYCLTDAFFKFLHKDLVSFSKIVEKDGVLSCRSCSHVIGMEQAKETLLIWNDRVLWKSRDRASCHGGSVEYLSLYLGGAVKKGIGLPTKVLLATKEEPKEYLYMWVIDKSLLVLKNPLIDQKKFLQLPNECSSEPDGADCKETIELAQQSLFKILYCFSEKSEKVNTWKDDDLVEELVLNREGIRTICRYLDNTGLLIPKTDRLVQEFCVGYLPKIS